MFSRNIVIALFLCVPLLVSAQAQYPAKSVRVVIPYPPGGGTDLLGRPMAKILTEKWKQSVLIDNRGGASGMVGAEIVANSAPDGYTILMCASAEVALNVALYPKMAYDPARDFAPVTQLAVSPLVLILHPSLPVRNIKEFIAFAKKRKGEVTYASAGPGGPQNIAGEWMKLMTKIDITHVPFKGGGPQIANVLGGHVHSAFIALPVAVPHIKAGKVRAIAMTSAQRSSAFPDVPTLSESGLPGFNVSQWWAILVPRGTPGDIIAKLHTDFVALTKSTEVVSRMAAMGAEPVGSTSAQLGEFMISEIAKYKKVVKDAHITVN